ncbi:hypothetical protein ACIQNU_31770 [Streptomyces sp. NPDC091292]|uniref:hypothetical protein n=1 Tax=Streptomyces sp. NPDC091292 TaxID=3365991 RepID=UPI0038068044
MHGHGLAPPQPQRPSTALLVVLRVIFVALALGSIGFLAWGTMLRIAIVTRKRRDWILFFASLVALVVAFAMLVADGTEDLSTWRGDLGMGLLLLSAFGGAVYFLYSDFHHFRVPPPLPYGIPLPPRHGGPIPPTAGYGYPQQLGTQHPVGQPVQPAPGPLGQPAPGPLGQTLPGSLGQSAPPTPPPFAAPHFATPPPMTPAPVPPPQPQPQPLSPQPPGRPGPARIDQVRAELDELSDYLRGQDRDRSGGGQSGGGQEGGR